MKLNFFASLKKPIFVQAPMIGVTDPAFRKIIAMCGPSDISWTEFVSASGLCRAQRRVQLLPMLQRVKGEKRCVAQLFGRVPEEFRDAAALVRELGFDGVDLNFGCPEKAVTTAQHAGAALINDFPLAQSIIRATKEGAQELPVSVKTRIGFDSIVVDDWLRNLFACEPAAISLHLRTRSMMSATHARWNDAVVGALTRERQRAGVSTRLIANGDVDSLELGAALVKHFDIDGIMFGRALFGMPWLFEERNRLQAANARSLNEILAERANNNNDSSSSSEMIVGSNPPRVALTHTLSEVLDVMDRHIDAYEELQQRSTAMGSHLYTTWLLMRKHFRAYLLHYGEARTVRLALQESNDATQSRLLLRNFRIELGLPLSSSSSSSTNDSQSIFENTQSTDNTIIQRQ